MRAGPGLAVNTAQQNSRQRNTSTSGRDRPSPTPRYGSNRGSLSPLLRGRGCLQGATIAALRTQTPHSHSHAANARTALVCRRGGGTQLLIALIMWPVTTHPFRDEGSTVSTPITQATINNVGAVCRGGKLKLYRKGASLRTHTLDRRLERARLVLP